VVATSSDARLGAIRLAWWRERLEELDRGTAPPAEPRLEAVARELLPRDVTGAELSSLEDAWLLLLAPFPWGEEVADGLRERGRLLFGVGARLLGANAPDADAAGMLWSLVDGAEHCSDAPSRAYLRDEAGRTRADLPRTVPRAVRRLTVLGALAAADLAGQRRGFVRLSAAVRHQLFGTFPRS
jgi:phytoene synthase